MPEPRSSTALTVPDQLRKDLLESQTRQIESTLQLPQIKVMPAGVGMFEFTDTKQRASDFTGIILGSTPRNVLWDKKFGEQSQDENDRFPACSSRDGRTGTPREGFRHAALGGREATGEEVIDCKACPYNQWGSGAMLVQNRNPKGKAVTNQRSVYITMEGRLLPVELTLPATSIPEFDAYLGRLLNRGKPMQAVLTSFKQIIKRNGGLAWGVVKFEEAAELDQETFDYVLTQMHRWESTIHPGTVTVEATTPAEPSLADMDNEEMPF